MRMILNVSLATVILAGCQGRQATAAVMETQDREEGHLLANAFCIDHDVRSEDGVFSKTTWTVFIDGFHRGNEQNEITRADAAVLESVKFWAGTPAEPSNHDLRKYESFQRLTPDLSAELSGPSTARSIRVKLKDGSSIQIDLTRGSARVVSPDNRSHRLVCKDLAK